MAEAAPPAAIVVAEQKPQGKYKQCERRTNVWGKINSRCSLLVSKGLLSDNCYNIIKIIL